MLLVAADGQGHQQVSLHGSSIGKSKLAIKQVIVAIVVTLATTILLEHMCRKFMVETKSTLLLSVEAATN